MPSHVRTYLSYHEWLNDVEHGANSSYNHLRQHGCLKNALLKLFRRQYEASDFVSSPEAGGGTIHRRIFSCVILAFKWKNLTTLTFLRFTCKSIREFMSHATEALATQFYFVSTIQTHQQRRPV
uniref:Uncharacterized protein n=1 Tax=Physcomitrium patens TaxID=3218 RepID=A9SQU4_PHYPA|nr:hypothetical protein PHYPA_021909 [Physcomitrium patens]